MRPPLGLTRKNRKRLQSHQHKWSWWVPRWIPENDTFEFDCCNLWCREVKRVSREEFSDLARRGI